MLTLRDKTIVITGATGGIGSALAEKMNSEDARLVLVGRDEKKLNSLNTKLGGTHTRLPCDFTDQNSVILLSKQIKQLGQIDALFNVAGIGIYNPITDTSFDDWNISINTNLTAPFILIKELLSHLQLSNMSLVLTIGSGAGVIPQRNRSLYASTKFALRGLSLCLSEEFKDSKPHFCLITLGSTITNFGGMSVEEKIKAHKEGRAYFTVEWVVNKLGEIIKDENRKDEYTLYPTDYGFGEWKKQ